MEAAILVEKRNRENDKIERKKYEKIFDTKDDSDRIGIKNSKNKPSKQVSSLAYRKKQNYKELKVV